MTTFGIGEMLDIIQDVVQNPHLFQRRQLLIQFKPNVPLQLVVVCTQRFHVQKRIGSFVHPHRPLQRALCTRVEPVAQSVVDERTMQSIHQFVHASLVFFTSRMSLSRFKQCGENRSAFGKELFPDVEVHSFVWVVQQLDEGVEFVGLHVTDCEGADVLKTTRDIHAFRSAPHAVFTSIVLIASQLLGHSEAIFG